MNILLVVNKTKDNIDEYVDKIMYAIGDKHDVTVSYDVLDYLKDKTPDLVITLGGDGTVLSSVHRLISSIEKKVSLPPFICVNLGYLGYLAEVDVENFQNAFELFCNRRAKFAKRYLLYAEVNGKHKYALNEFVVAPVFAGRMLNVEVDINGHRFADIAGDGVIISTPTGSTGYALSAGGPILSSQVKAMVLVPICPHQLSNRPIVLSDKDEVVIRKGKRNRQKMQLCFDGYEQILFEDDVKISFSSMKIYTFRYNKDEYSLVRSKMGWG